MGKKLTINATTQQTRYNLRNRDIFVTPISNTQLTDQIKKKVVFTDNNKNKNVTKKQISNNKRSRKNYENDNENDVVDDDFTWNDFNNITNDANYDESNANNWVSATKIKNFLLKEPLIDWLDIYYSQLNFNENPDKNKKKFKMNTNNLNLSISKLQDPNVNMLCENGNIFERKIIDHLKEQYPKHIKTGIENDTLTKSNDKTFEYMYNGIPIIEQAEIYNHSNQTYGIVDLLIRSDWVNKIFDEPVLEKNMEKLKAPFLKGNYHYIVIDIKWSTMKIRANGKTLENNDRFPCYKGQLTIYNAALGLLQGYTPPSAFIMAKSWKYRSLGTEGYNCFTKLGHIDFINYDKEYIKHTYNAIKWIRNVRCNGFNWSCVTPSVIELYPNMCNKYDSPHHSVKQDLAIRINEITDVWMVGIKHRQIAHSKGIMSWDDKRCKTKNIGMNGAKISRIVDKLLNINRNKKKTIEPKIIKNNVNDWQHENKYDFYIDFETLSGTLYNEINIMDSKAYEPFLFLIGVGYIENDEWFYVSFKVDNVSIKEEKRIVDEMATFIKLKCKNNNPKLFHWSNAEKSIITTLNKRHNKSWFGNATWCDIYKVFIDEPIVIKGARKFSLKTIATAMKEHGMINTNWDDCNISNGLAAMFDGVKYYKNDCKNKEIINDIIKYNEYDCKVVYEIVDYLRTSHTK